jgi:hypothetical protein
MRRVPLAVVLTLAAAAPAYAQTVPQTITFSARLESGGVPLSGGHDFDFSLWTAPAPGGAVVWGESLASVQVTDGLVDVELGAIDAIAGAFTGETLYLEVTVDGVTLAPRTEITSVPYAQRAAVAADAQTLHGLLYTAFMRVGSVLACPPNQHMVGLNGTTGDVVCAADAAGTTYTAGSGLALNGNQFSVIPCATGQVLQRQGAPGSEVWGCGDPGDITGIITAVGSGLIGGNTTGTPSLSIRDCGENQTLSFEGSDWICRPRIFGIESVVGSGIEINGGDGFFHNTGNLFLSVDENVIQTRLSSSCPTGSAMTGVSATGVVSCTRLPGFKASPASGGVIVTTASTTLVTMNVSMPAGGVTNMVVKARWDNISGTPVSRLNCTLFDAHASGNVNTSFLWDPGDADNNMDQVTYFNVVSNFGGTAEGLHTLTLACSATGGAGAQAAAQSAQIMVYHHPGATSL